ncbi:MAG: deoxyhypusine synthase [Candidatus Diapherotrites archaeon]|nr:deoxyhypusine synthase [Candidatus Diapherotrites archaeon]
MKKTFQQAKDSIFKSNKPFSGSPISGYNFDKGLDFKKLLDSFGNAGFQATNLGRAIEIVKKMRKEKVKIFLGYTSNQVSSGNREIIRYLVQNKLVDCLVTTTGGIEEDFIKTKFDFLQGDFRADGVKLREKGVNRIGNIFVPNDRYVWFEEFFQPILQEFLERQRKEKKTFSASEIIAEMGRQINNESSIYFWAQKNKIPVFCPAFMDGAVGDNVYFFNYNISQELKIDQAFDHHRLIEMVLDAEETGILILGSGIVKHTLCNANMYREGAKYAVYMNTASEFDGSDSGAEPEEAKSWGKISANSETVKVVGDTTILLPLLVAGAFIDKK